MIWCGGCFSVLLMLLCPWLLSLLYNSLRPIFLRTRVIITFLYVRRFIEPRQHCAFVDLNKVQWWWWRKSWGRNPPEYQIDVLQKIVFKEKEAVVYILIQASASQYWITRELLWCFCMQHMIYYCTFCGTIRASEDTRAVRETLLSKLEWLLFLFFPLINCFKMMRLIHLQAIFYLQPLAIWHFIILIHSPIHSVIYTKKKPNAHHEIEEAVYRHSLHQFVLCQ